MAMILVACSDEKRGAFFAEMLKEAGHEPLPVGSCEAALRLLQDFRLDLVILDAALSGAGGVEACCRIKGVEGRRYIPVIMVIEGSGEEETVKAIDAGADDVIAESTPRGVILARVRANLRAKDVYDEVVRMREDQAAIMEVMLDISSHLDLEEVLQVLVERTAEQVGGGCSIIITDESLQEGRIMACSDGEESKNIRIDLKKYPEILHSIDTRDAVVIDDVENEPIVRNVAATLKKCNISSLIVIPLIFHGEILGTLFLRARGEKEKFDDEDIRLCKIMAGAASNAIKNALYYTRLKEQKETLESLCEELKMLDRSRSDFFAVTAHELSSPLSVIQTCTEILLDGMYGELNTLQKNTLSKAARSCEQMSEFVRDLQDVARAESGNLELHLTREMIGETVKSVVDKMVPVAERNGMTLSLLEPLPDAVLTFDRRRIEQVLTNLISNAVKHNRKGCRIVVGARMTEKECVVFVEDDGKGIAEGDLPHIFEGYFRTRAGKKKSGLGLGLYICKMIIDAHGGSIRAEKGERRGSRFVFTLPLRRRKKESPPMPDVQG